MKKIFSALAVGAMVCMIFVGCSSNKNDTMPQPTVESTIPSPDNATSKPNESKVLKSNIDGEIKTFAWHEMLIIDETGELCITSEKLVFTKDDKLPQIEMNISEITQITSKPYEDKFDVTFKHPGKDQTFRVSKDFCDTLEKYFNITKE